MNVSTANAITYTKEGNKRRIDCRWATWTNIKSFYANLPSADRTTNFYVNNLICVNSNFGYGRITYVGTESNGTSLVCQDLTNYNQANATGTINDDNRLIGSLEWYV